MKHHVHIYAVVRVKVIDVEAGDRKDAIGVAEDMVAGDIHELINWHHPREYIESITFAEGIDGYLVDEIGDDGIIVSTGRYNAGGEFIAEEWV